MLSPVVLVVDPDAFQRQLIDMLLAMDNYQLDYAAYGGETLDYLKHHTPDAIILAHHLPDISGADICSKLKSTQRLHDVPVILTCTPLDYETVKTLGRAVGADVVLAKPLGDKRLRERLAELIKAARPDPATAEMAAEIETQTEALADAPDLSLGHGYDESIPAFGSEPDLFDSEETLNKLQEDEALEELLKASMNTTFLPPDDSQADTTHHDSEPSLEPEAVEMTFRPSPEPPSSPSPNKDSSIDEAHLLAELEPLQSPAAEASADTSKNPRDPVVQAELVSLRMQVEDLGEENRLLRATVRELSQGKSLFSTDTYLDMIEELETLRRLTQRQTSQLEMLQQQLNDLRSQLHKPEEARRNLSLWGRRRS